MPRCADGPAPPLSKQWALRSLVGDHGVLLLLPPRLPLLAEGAAQIDRVGAQVLVHAVELLRDIDRTLHAGLEGLDGGVRVELLRPFEEVHHALRLVDGGADLPVGHHGANVLLRLRSAGQLGGLGDVREGEREVGLRESVDVAEHQPLDALLGEPKVVVPRQGGRVLLEADAQCGDLARGEGRRVLGVRRDARLDVALQHGGGVLGQLGQLPRDDERAEDALLVGLDHDGVQHRAGRRAAEDEALHRLLELLEGDVHQAAVVMVE
mmetsp:Transcript_29565/g.70207  ORF Transcript_29565/g.70207 Transcript_29565/m.70207 type:complete len:266 (-) Transcript_29565:283-1080(-)